MLLNLLEKLVYFERNIKKEKKTHYNRIQEQFTNFRLLKQKKIFLKLDIRVILMSRDIVILKSNETMNV